MTATVDIAICTFRRAHVAHTLRSIAQLSLPPDTTIRIIVADNDDTPSARELIETTARECALNLTYLHAPARNISIARNACLAASSTPFLAFIDDDELVTPNWLSALLKTQHETGADVILGPVKALYNSDYPHWMQAGDFHSTLPVWVNNTIVTGYSCNVLIKRAAFFESISFREDLGRSGGEDTAYFWSLHMAGARIQFAPDAIVTEAVPQERATLRWLLKRRFRSGQTHGLLLLETPINTPIEIATASAKALYCLLFVVLSIGWPQPRAFWLLRSAVHVGVVSRLLGCKTVEPYGK